MCPGGSKKQTTNSTSTYTPAPEAGAAVSGAIQNSQQVATTPFNYDTTKQVAGFNPQQTQSFNQVGQMQGMYAPYIDAASGYTTAGAAPITGAQIQNYQNPYQQQVIDAAMANINHQNATQQRDLIGNVAGQQGLGNNRAGIMQAELARGQGANTNQTIANLLSGGFNTALGAAQQDSNRQLTAGNQMANYGSTAQNLALQGTQALNASGNQQQAQAQADYDAASGNEQAATMWPFQTAQFENQAVGGLAPLLGGTTTGNSTTKQTSNPGVAGTIGSIATIAGMLADGGRVGYAGGGGIDMGGFTFPGMMQLAAARPVMPQLPGAPSMGGDDQGGGLDLKKSLDLGKNARAGIDNVLRDLSPSKGWGASLEDIGSTGGGGMLSGIGSLLGFADGGSLPAAPRLTGSSYVPGVGSAPGAAPDSYYAPGLAALAASRAGPAPAPQAAPAPAPSTGPAQAPHGLEWLSSLLGNVFNHTGSTQPGGTLGDNGLADLISRLQQRASGGAVRRYDDGGMVDGYSPFDSFGYDDNAMNGDFPGITKIDTPAIPAQLSGPGKSDMPQQMAAEDPILSEPVAGMAKPFSGSAFPRAQASPDATAAIDPLDLIKREEGYAPTAKWDVKQFTGGWGSKAEKGETFTPEKADAYLRRDAAGPMAWVEQNAPNATPGQKAALTSFGYHEGVGALGNLQDDIASGDWGKVGQHMQLYNKVRDKDGNLVYNEAIAGRRAREVGLLQGGDLGKMPDPSYPSPSGGDAPPPARSLVQKGLDPDQPQVSKGYDNAVDKHGGGLLKRLFGIDFNPLNLDKDERMALVSAGLGMMSSGNVGTGGLQGLEYLQNAAKLHQDANIAAQKLAMEFEKERAPKLMKGGTDAAGNDVMVWADPYNRTATPVNLGGTAASGSSAVTQAMQDGVTGQAFLETVQKESPEQANLIKKLGNYEIPLPTARNPKTLRLIAQTEQAFPGWNAQDYKAQQNLRTSFMSGKDADEIKSLNTAIGHTMSAYESIDALGNTGSSILNTGINAVRGQTSPEFRKARSRMMTEMDTAVAEFNRATTGKPITVDEHKAMRERLSQNSAPEDLKETMMSFAELMDSRLKASAEKWNSGLKLSPDDPRYKTTETLLNKDSLVKFNKLMGRDAGEKPAGGNSGDLTAQRQGNTLSGEAPRPSGMSDGQLLQQAQQKLKARPDLAPKVQKQLEAWGVHF